jgi:hypothetical protein
MVSNHRKRFARSKLRFNDELLETVAPIAAVPDHWALDFNEGLPRGWEIGQLVFDSPEHNPGLTVDRIWGTRGMPAEPRSPSNRPQIGRPNPSSLAESPLHAAIVPSPSQPMMREPGRSRYQAAVRGSPALDAVSGSRPAGSSRLRSCSSLCS